MKDLHRHAHAIKDHGHSVQEFARSLAVHMNMHDKACEDQWIEVAMVTADYALYIYRKSPEIILSKLLEKEASK